MNTTMAEMMNHDDNGIRLAAALQAGTMHDEQSARALVDALGRESDFQVREMLTWAAVQRAGEIDDALLDALDSPEASVRQQAAHVLSKIGDPVHAPRLATVIADADPEVAVKAFRAAANTGDAFVVPLLVARLASGDGEQRDALVRALVTLDALAVPALVEALGSEDVAIREHAAEALGQIGSPAADAAAAALAAVLDDGSAEVRLMAVSSLGQLDGEAADAALAMASESSDARVAAVARRFRADRAQQS